MTERALQRQLGATLFEKSRARCDSHDVLWITSHDDHRLRALVSEGGQLYTAVFGFAEDAITGSCSCRGAAPCRHMGAAALAHIREQSRDPRQERRPAELRAERSGPRAVHAQTSYRVVFLLDLSTRSDQVTIRPAYRTTRRDGMPGTFVEMSQRPNTLPGELMPLFNAVGLNGAPLASVIEILTSGSLIPIFGPERPPRRRAGFDRIERLSVGFRFSQLEGGVPYFTPALSVTASRRPYVIERDAHLGASVADGTVALLHHESETVLYRFDSRSWVHLFDALKELPRNCGPNAVARLTQRLAELEIEDVDVETPPRHVQYAREKPVPLLRLRFDGSLSCAVSFRYGPAEASWSSPDDPLIAERRGETGTQTIVVQRRDFQAEQVWRATLKKLCKEQSYAFDIAYSSGRPAVLPGTQAAFLMRYGRRLLETGVELLVAGVPVRSSAGALGYSVAASGADWLDVEAHVSTADGAEQAVLEEISHRGGVLRSGTRFIVLTVEHLEQVHGLVACGFGHGGRARLGREHPGVYDAVRDNLLPQRAESDFQVALGAFSDELRSVGTTGGAQLEKLDLGDFRAELRSYQQAGFSWLELLHRRGLGGCLADDMGLGKTVQSLALLSHLHAAGRLERALCVVPISTLGNWEREIGRFTPQLTAVRHRGVQRSNDPNALRSADIVLVSYSTLRNDIELFSKIRFDYVILDEAQAIKNPNSKTFHAVRKLQAAGRLALTGTPLENNTVELWAIFDFLNPGMIGSLQSFRREFGIPIEREADEARLGRLQTLIRPFLLRRRKLQVAPELPPREEMTVWCEMGEEQRRIYEAVRSSYRQRVQSSIAEHGVSRSSSTVFEGLLRLRQIAILPALAAPAYQQVCSEKYELVLDQLEEVVASGNKVIVFSQFTSLLKKLESYVSGRGTGYAYLDGSTKQRQQQIDRFQRDASVSIFLISLKAGGVGLNLTAADYVFLVDPWWNPAVEAQAIDRAHRIGRTNPVIATRFITSGTVEEKIRELQQRKQALAEQLMGQSIGALTPAEVLALFD